MDFTIPKAYKDYRKRLEEFVRTDLDTTDLVERDQSSSFARDLWDKCGEFGLLGLSAEKEYGGTADEIDVFLSAYAMEGFGYACKDNGLGIAINAHMWAVQMTISLFGSESAKRKYLPKLTSGAWIGAHALTEESSGSDVFNMKATAQKVDGGYIINGKKRLVTLAPVSDVAVVFASTDLSKGKWGISAFIADASMPGYIRGENQQKMGLRTAPFGEITFEECFVPDENRIGKEGAGFSISNHSLEYDRCCILAAKLGAMQRQLDDCVAYAKSHKRSGQSIGKYQAVSHRIADMQMRLETSRLLLYKMAWLKKNEQPAMLEGSMLKLHLGEAFVASSMDAIRIHGGNGYLSEHGIERDLRDAIGGVIYAGTSDIQRNIIASYLGL